MGKLRRFARLSNNEKVCLLRAAAVVLAVRVGLWVLPFGRLRQWMSPASAAGRESKQRGIYSVKQIVWSVKAASRYVPDATCLTQAIAVQKLLAESAHASSMNIGVAKSGELGFQAHAWVKCGAEIVVGGPDVSHYQSLLTWESPISGANLLPE